jgi:hypothetical protein
VKNSGKWVVEERKLKELCEENKGGKKFLATPKSFGDAEKNPRESLTVFNG